MADTSGLVAYHNHQNQLVGWVTEDMALAFDDVRLIYRQRDGKLMRVKDRSARLHVGEFGCSDTTSRPTWQQNDGKCFEEELSCHRVYALKGRGI